MLLMVEKGIRGGICHRYSLIKNWDVNNLYAWAMAQKLPVNNFKQVEDISEFVKVL